MKTIREIVKYEELHHSATYEELIEEIIYNGYTMEEAIQGLNEMDPTYEGDKKPKIKPRKRRKLRYVDDDYEVAIFS
jgi:hypothetical protein